MKGLTYEGKGDIESYSAAILDHDQETALAISSVERSAGSIAICLENQSSVIRTLLFARPKRIVWTLVQNGNSVVISNDIFLYSWYLAIVLLSCFAWPPLLKLALGIVESKPILAAVACLFSLVLLAFSYFLLLAGGGRRIPVPYEVLQSAALPPSCTVPISADVASERTPNVR